jgi:hypothetical protein
MRNWGIVVTAFYALVVIFLLTYGAILLAEAGSGETYLPEHYEFLEHFLGGAWVPVLFLVCGQVLLLFLSVDSSWRRRKAQRHAMVTAALVGTMVFILAISVFFAVGMAHSGDGFELVLESWFDLVPEDWSDESLLTLGLTSVLLIWGFWGVLFYTFSKRVSNVVDSAVNWLIKGSVLELLVAVPCHIIVRQRDECCAQFVTAYGIATGIAIMLMAFGPSALFLYQRKLSEYKNRSSATMPDSD